MREPETNCGTQIQQNKKNVAAAQVDKLFPIHGLETNYSIRMALTKLLLLASCSNGIGQGNM